ncbi:hypothetical protein K438DRAFT_2029236 [Mycena galopus ATCC 62051]|nr:hypothetical protein K438DRAFT_2029236 [Mycena galopus ATCC 62051]
MLEMRPEPIIHCFGESSRRSHNLPGKILWRLFLIADSIFPFFLKFVIYLSLIKISRGNEQKPIHSCRRRLSPKRILSCLPLVSTASDLKQQPPRPSATIRLARCILASKFPLHGRGALPSARAFLPLLAPSYRSGLRPPRTSIFG